MKKLNIKLQVITKVPNIDFKDNGNLSDDTFMGVIDKFNKNVVFKPYNDYERFKNETKIPVKLEVFQLGEIIVVDDREREIGGYYRKASKWHVEYQLFDPVDIDKAIRLSERVIKLRKKY